MQETTQRNSHLKRGACIGLAIVLLLAIPFWADCAARAPMFKPGDSAMGVVCGYMIAVLVWLRALFLECRDLARERTAHFRLSFGVTVAGLCSAYGILRLSGILDFGRTYPDDRLFGFASEILSGAGLACIAFLKAAPKSNTKRTTWVTVLGFLVGNLLVCLPLPFVFQLGQWIRWAKGVAA